MNGRISHPTCPRLSPVADRGCMRCANGDAIFYILRSGCAWRLLPHDLPVLTRNSSAGLVRRRLAVQTTSRFPIHWWGMNSTLSGMHQFNEPPGPHRGTRKPSTCKNLRSLNLHGYADSVQSA